MEEKSGLGRGKLGGIETKNRNKVVWVGYEGDGKGEVEERVLQRIEREASPQELVNTVKNTLGVEEKGGNEGVSRNPVNIIMGGESEGLRVLREIDQNVTLP